MKKAVSLLLICMTISGFAQERFITYGVIEFEKKVDLYKQIDNPIWLESFKEKNPQFKTSYFNLYFRDDRTLFTPGRLNEQNIVGMADDKRSGDVVFSDLKRQVFVKKQQIFEKTFLCSDSIRPIEWKITNDTREIAGFSCRKAVGKVLDSVYVIAFFTEQIPVSGGPLSFCNLPGLVLGVSVPRVNMTIIATRLQLIDPSPQQLSPPSGASGTLDTKGLSGVLQKTFSNWSGWWSTRYRINALL